MTEGDFQFVWPTFAGEADDICAWDGPDPVGRVFCSRYGWSHWQVRRRNQVVQSGRAEAFRQTSSRGAISRFSC